MEEGKKIPHRIGPGSLTRLCPFVLRIVAGSRCSPHYGRVEAGGEPMQGPWDGGMSQGVDGYEHTAYTFAEQANTFCRS